MKSEMDRLNVKFGFEGPLEILAGLLKLMTVFCFLLWTM